MKTILTIALILPLFLCDDGPGGSTNLPEPIDREADVKALSNAKVVTWRQLYYEQDHQGLDAFLNDEFVLIDGDGHVSTKADEVKWLSENSWNGPEDFIYTVKDIIFLGPDSALVYGYGSSTRETEAGEPCRHTYWSSNSFRRVQGRWKPSSSHVSGAKCEPF